MRLDRVEFAAALARENLTVKKLSEMTGISRCTVTAVKNGKSCQKRTGEALAAILGRQIIVKED